MNIQGLEVQLDVYKFSRDKNFEFILEAFEELCLRGPLFLGAGYYINNKSYRANAPCAVFRTSEERDFFVKAEDDEVMISSLSPVAFDRELPCASDPRLVEAVFGDLPQKIYGLVENICWNYRIEKDKLIFDSQRKLTVSLVFNHPFTRATIVDFVHFYEKFVREYGPSIDLSSS